MPTGAPGSDGRHTALVEIIESARPAPPSYGCQDYREAAACGRDRRSYSVIHQTIDRSLSTPAEYAPPTSIMTSTHPDQLRAHRRHGAVSSRDSRIWPCYRRHANQTLRPPARQGRVGVDYRTPRRLDKALFQQLATSRWVADHRNLLVTGPCGVGKSWLSCALAQKACRDGYSVHYARVPRLFADLDLAHGDGRFARLFPMLVKVDLLVLDDWGPDRLSASHRRDLMEIVEDRYGRGSILITSQLPVATWLEVIAEPTLGDAILDRIVHNAYRTSTRRPFDAQDQSPRGRRPGTIAGAGDGSRQQDHQGSKEMRPISNLQAALDAERKR